MYGVSEPAGKIIKTRYMHIATCTSNLFGSYESKFNLNYEKWTWVYLQHKLKNYFSLSKRLRGDTIEKIWHSNYSSKILS